MNIIIKKQDKYNAVQREITFTSALYYSMNYFES